MASHHGGLNNSNIFYNPEYPPEARLHLFDWGDSSMSHPFSSMCTLLVSLEISVDWDENDPRDDPFSELYLQRWKTFAGVEALHAAYRLSRWLRLLSAH